ncbi:MAG: SemiSWEET family transporter [Ignavibacteria bacterium]|jgi:MtN3 and saliva related transmembrane protein|nr:SemiSWEET family transporter [Ignavibacteria bacterium]MDH7528574.1 SemiSWEET family transporter [Ignavibacteria bacterium]
MNIYDIVGGIAVTLSCFNLLPQVLKGFKTKSVNDISWIFIFMIITATIFWFIYGKYRNDWAIMLTNSIIFGFAVILLIQKIMYSGKKKIDEKDLR